MSASTLKWLITIVAIALTLAHLFFPEVRIDAITVTLVIVAAVPWLSPLFKSLEFPGGLKFEFQEVKDKLETLVAKQTEPVAGATLTVKAFSVNDDATRAVLKALGNQKYTWRYLGGLAEETGLSRTEIRKAIKWLLDNELATEISDKSGTLWGLNKDGWNLLRALQRDELLAEKSTSN